MVILMIELLAGIVEIIIAVILTGNNKKSTLEKEEKMKEMQDEALYNMLVNKRKG